MTTTELLFYIAVMAGITYFCRVVTMVIFRKKIENRYIQSFLLYMPYGVLSAMVFPAVFSSTASLISAVAGTAVALILAYFKKGLLPVALAATATVFIVEKILPLVG